MCEFFVRMAEVTAESKDAAVDARLDFALEEWIAGVASGAEIPVAGSAIPTQRGFEERNRLFDGGIAWVGASRAQELQREESRQPDGSSFAAPGAVGFLMRENRCAEAFARDADAFCSDGRRFGVGEVSQRLPADGGIGIEQPVDRVHDRILH